MNICTEGVSPNETLFSNRITDMYTVVCLPVISYGKGKRKKRFNDGQGDS